MKTSSLPFPIGSKVRYTRRFKRYVPRAYTGEFTVTGFHDFTTPRGVFLQADLEFPDGTKYSSCASNLEVVPK